MQVGAACGRIIYGERTSTSTLALGGYHLLALAPFRHVRAYYLPEYKLI